MKENVLDVLLYLFENYLYDEELETDQDTLTVELQEAGFGTSMINQAFDWLEKLADENDSDDALKRLHRPPQAVALRVYHESEAQRISVQAQGLILTLEQCGVLTANSRERVIQQLMTLGEDEIAMDQVQWVILMVLSNSTSQGEISELAESLIMDGLEAVIH